MEDSMCVTQDAQTGERIEERYMGTEAYVASEIECESRIDMHIKAISCRIPVMCSLTN